MSGESTGSALNMGMLMKAMDPTSFMGAQAMFQRNAMLQMSMNSMNKSKFVSPEGVVGSHPIDIKEVEEPITENMLDMNTFDSITEFQEQVPRIGEESP